jgi:hypothetical protein
MREGQLSALGAERHPLSAAFANVHAGTVAVTPSTLVALAVCDGTCRDIERNRRVR